MNTAPFTDYTALDRMCNKLTGYAAYRIERNWPWESILTDLTVRLIKHNPSLTGGEINGLVDCIMRDAVASVNERRAKGL